MFLSTEESLIIAKNIFQSEKWIQKSENVFVAESRINVNKQDFQKLEKELEQAFIFEKYGHSSVLVPEAGEGKHYDSISDGKTTEFKTITGSLDKVGKHFLDGIKKAENVFLRIKSDFSQKEIYNAFRGRLKQYRKQLGIVYVFLESSDKFIQWDIKTICDSIEFDK